MLDTHTLYWLVSGEMALTDQALVDIGLAQESGQLYLSPITAWELSVATQKPRRAGRPHLGSDPVDQWFRQAVHATMARVVSINSKIALEAANVVTATGHKDPGDCYLMATARTRKLVLVTRDEVIHDIAAAEPGYLSVVGC